ncbi:MAG: putative lipid II flippase FtsW, partial [bacterium]|nr:putative lipid II flippase FtsW [bacterium]
MRLDFFLIGVVLGLLAFGLLMVYDASVISAQRDFGDKYFYVRNQGLWVGLGLVLMTAMTFIPLKLLSTIARPAVWISIALLVLVFIPGIGIKTLGASRWMNLGVFRFQPSELAKLALVLYLATWFALQKGKINIRDLSKLGATAATMAGLILLQPDLGTAIILIGSSLLLYLVAGGPWLHFLVIVPALILGAFGFIQIAPYRLARMTTFLHPFEDIRETGYHMYQALLAIGSGGVFGLGIGQSRQKYAFLPEATTDSIFAIIAEEVGFIGASIVVLLFLLLLWRGFRIAFRAKDVFPRLLAAGITCMIGVQAFMNIGSMVAIIPLTGVVLPLVSYGGSSMI